MEDRKNFCEKCRKETGYRIEDEQSEGTIRGEIYSYYGKTAYCAECGSEIYDAEVNDYNLKALYDVYREKNGIISQEKIREIPNKYAIGKRPLSLLLGWGEQTFSRYCEGDIPTKQYSEILQSICDDPRLYLRILESNRENLKSNASFEKSRRAVKRLLDTSDCEKSKIDMVIEYLLNQCEDVTPLALQKALYYVQGFFYAFYDTFLFTEECEAWVHGPVYRDIYFRYKNYCFDAIESKGEIFDDSAFSASEKAVFDSVVKNICCYSGKVLERFTHAETPWLQTRGDLPFGCGSDRIIDKSLIGDYFKTVKDKYHMLSPSDMKEYTQKMFERL